MSTRKEIWSLHPDRRYYARTWAPGRDSAGSVPKDYKIDILGWVGHGFLSRICCESWIEEALLVAPSLSPDDRSVGLSDLVPVRPG